MADLVKLLGYFKLKGMETKHTQTFDKYKMDSQAASCLLITQTQNEIEVTLSSRQHADQYVPFIR